MNRRSEPLKITFTLSPETVKSVFDLIAEASGSNAESRKAHRRMDASKKAVFGQEEQPVDINLMVSRKQASELLQLSTRTIDNLKREGLMPQPIRIGRAVRWNRSELVAWVDAGCPDCNHWSYVESSAVNDSPTAIGKTIRTRQSRGKSAAKSKGKKSSGRASAVPAEPPAEAETRFQKFVTSIGLDYNNLPRFTNGQVLELAEQDLPVMHNWKYKGGALPEEVLELMKNKLLDRFPAEEFGVDRD